MAPGPARGEAQEDGVVPEWLPKTLIEIADSTAKKIGIAGELIDVYGPVIVRVRRQLEYVSFRVIYVMEGCVKVPIMDAYVDASSGMAVVNKYAPRFADLIAGALESIKSVLGGGRG